jgi:hypothetical protein
MAMGTRTTSPLLAVLAFVASACSAAPVSETATTNAFPLDAYATASSDGRAYRVEVRTSPEQPPTRGELQIELRVTDASGAPADGLPVTVTPWMPAMGHGTSMTPTIKAEGNGAYRVEDVELFMPGTWQLRVALGSDGLTIPITVQ